MNTPLLLRVVHGLCPWIKKEHTTLSLLSQSVKVEITAYSNLSKQLKDEVDKNHFSKHLRYEKVEG